MQGAARLPEAQVATLTRKGQVTIPASIRKLLGVGPHDKVTFVVEGDSVRIKRTTSVVEATAGIFAGRGPALTAEMLREAAEEAIAVEVRERMGD